MARCKNCKDKFTPKYFLQKHCMEKDECVKAEIELKKATIWKAKRTEWKIDTHSKENKTALQKEINLLARKIDAVFGFKCIDLCDREYGKQIDGAHFHSVGSNSSLRYNLHNIHSADSHCNNYSNTHISGYKLGLEKRYGKDYLELVEGLPLLYKETRLNNQEIHDKLILFRKLNRDFNTYQLSDGISARNLFNSIIGIYN